MRYRSEKKEQKNMLRGVSFYHLQEIFLTNIKNNY